jgi:hypothetical protein
MIMNLSAGGVRKCHAILPSTVMRRMCVPRSRGVEPICRQSASASPLHQHHKYRITRWCNGSGDKSATTAAASEFAMEAPQMDPQIKLSQSIICVFAKCIRRYIIYETAGRHIILCVCWCLRDEK